MSHITQEQVRELAERSGFLFQDVGYAPTFHTMPLEYSEKCFQRLCNAAIQHYIDSAALAQPIKEIVVNADYREMWIQLLRLNQELTARLAAAKKGAV